MTVKSRIFVTEAVENSKKHAKADDNYFVCYVELENGTLLPALFTDSDLQKAFKRAEKNPEDLLPPYVEVEDVEVTPEQRTWLDKILGR